MNIGILEIQLKQCLKGIHISGVVRIVQGSDDLSKGIWMFQLQGRHHQEILLETIFDTLLYNPTLVRSCIIYTVN